MVFRAAVMNNDTQRFGERRVPAVRTAGTSPAARPPWSCRPLARQACIRNTPDAQARAALNLPIALPHSHFGGNLQDSLYCSFTRRTLRLLQITDGLFLFAGSHQAVKLHFP